MMYKRRYIRALAQSVRVPFARCMRPDTINDTGIFYLSEEVVEEFGEVTSSRLDVLDSRLCGRHDALHAVILSVKRGDFCRFFEAQL